MISEKLRELREAEAAATKGDWLPKTAVMPRYLGNIDDPELYATTPWVKTLAQAGADLRFIASARAHFSTMLDVIEAAKKVSDRHNWHPDMGECICTPHKEFHAALQRLAGVR